MAKKAADGGPSRMAMVREALGAVGADAKPKEIDEYVRSKYGAAIPAPIISAYKSAINSRSGGGGRRGRPAGGRDERVDVRDVVAVRELIGRYGADQLLRLIKMLG